MAFLTEAGGMAGRTWAGLTVATLLLGGCAVERVDGRFPAQDRPDGEVVVDGGVETDGGEAPATPLVDPTGTWLLFTEDRKCLYSAGDTVEALIWTWYTVDVERREGSDIVLRQRIAMCKQELSPLAFGFLTVVPDIVTDSLVPNEVNGYLFGSEPGSPYFSERTVENWGIDGLPLDEPLPTTPDDPRVVDLDEDGLPGVTLPVETVTGLAICDPYVVQRVTGELEGEVVNALRLEGVPTIITEKEIIGASTELCESGDLVESPGRDRFVMVRIDGQSGSADADVDGDGVVSCPEVREVFETIMTRYDIVRGEPMPAENCTD